MEILGTILIGVAAGWLCGMIFKGSSLGFIGNLVFGILGSIVGYWLFGKLDISLGTGWVGSILTGATGAIVILFIFNLVFRKK